MSLGLLGFIGYGLFLAGTMLQTGSSQRRVLRGDARIACIVALVAILSFTLAAATFTLFQFNVLIASLVALLAAVYPEPESQS